MKVFPLLCGHQHMQLRYRNKISASETVCELFVVKKTNLTSVSPEVIPSPCFGMLWLTTDLDRESLCILKTEAQSMTGSMNSYFKKWKVTCCDMMISCHLQILLLKLKWYTHLCKGCGILYQRDRFCFNFSLIYCELVDDG